MGSEIIGIQGGEGSFNDEAIRYYLDQQEDYDARIEFLYSSAAVVAALQDGRITLGQVAVHNSSGGLVRETLEAMGQAKFEFLRSYSIPIRHCLMGAPGASLEDIDTVLSHPQALAQCRETLARTYPQLTAIPGQGDQIDPARVARSISIGEVGANTATLSCARIAEVYGLELLAQGLQDDPANRTTFALLKSADSGVV